MKIVKICAFLALLGPFGQVLAQENCDIIIKDRKFQSGNLKMVKNAKSCEFELQSGQRHRLSICNQDKAVAEFESHDLVIEKIIPGNKGAILKIRKIEKGKIYEFEEEFSGNECVFRGI